MSRSSILLVVGFMTALVAFAGIPLTWIRIVLPVLGLIVIAIGFIMRSERIARLKREMPPPPSLNDISPIA